MLKASMRVRFWGVRGSIPCPGPSTIRYGGNTPCIEVRCGDHVLIFDAGTGLRSLGIDRASLRADVPVTIAGIVTLLEETKPGMHLLEIS